MIRLFKPSGGGTEENKSETQANHISPGLKRLEKDMLELDAPSHVILNQDKVKEGYLILTVKPTKDSLWNKGTYTFDIKVSPEYPFEAPKITCNEKVFFK